MAGAPRFKVYDAQGQYEAACKHAEVAAGVVARCSATARPSVTGIASPTSCGRKAPRR